MSMKYGIVLVVLIHRKNFKEILLVKRAREPEIGKWSLAGGFGALETEVNPLKAVRKEIYDDLGVEFNSSLYKLKFWERPGPTLYLYFHGGISGHPKPISKTISAAEWFPVEKVLNMKLAFEEKDKPVIKQFKKDFTKAITRTGLWLPGKEP